MRQLCNRDMCLYLIYLSVGLSFSLCPCPCPFIPKLTSGHYYRGRIQKSIFYTMGKHISNLYIDRQNFGTSIIPFNKTIIKYRISDLIYVFLIYCLDWFVFERIEPYERQFSINDLTISHPFALEERVSGPALLKIVTIVPVIIIFTFNLLLTPKNHKVYVFYTTVVGLFVSLGTTIFITDVLKNWIGRCRPDFLARCIPSATALKDTLYYASEICTTENRSTLLDGFRTTPSGHSSTSWCTFGYVSFWLMGQLMCFHVHGGGAWRSIVCILPSLYASYVALSRTQDYRHHFIDVLLGSLLGTLVAWWSYRRVFPAISDPHCYVPYLLIKERDGDLTTAGLNEELQSKDFYAMLSDADGENYMMANQDLESHQEGSESFINAPTNSDRHAI